MEDDTIRVAIGLRLGAPLCRLHSRYHCGAEVDYLTTHGLNCRHSKGQHYCHGALIQRALTSAKILEPTGIYHSDGKRPDGTTVVPWERGKLLIWDATCADTFAPSYISSSSSEAGAVAALAEDRKMAKYEHLNPAYSFTPIAVEMMGVLGPLTRAFLKDLGRCISRATGEERSHHYLMQRLSVAIQRGNAASVLDTIGPAANSEYELFTE